MRTGIINEHISESEYKNKPFRKQRKWDKFFIEMVGLVSKKSKDKSRKVGCVLVGEGHEVLSIGYNGFPRDVMDDISKRHERPTKYFFTEHAERNACYNAARIGVSLKDSTAYMRSFPCADCARAMIQVGVKRVVACKKNNFNDSKWSESICVGKEMMKEVGIDLEEI